MNRHISRYGAGLGEKQNLSYLAGCIVLVLALIAMTLAPASADARTTRAYQNSFGPPEGPGETERIAVDQSNGDVYVVSRSGGEISDNKVFRFDLNGVPKNFTAGPDVGTNTLTGFEEQIQDVAVDRSGGPLSGTIYVVVGGGNVGPGKVVRVFSANGESRGTITGVGAFGGFFASPNAITVDQSSGSLYVFNNNNSHVWRYAPSSPSGLIDDSDYTVTGISGVFHAGNQPSMAAFSDRLYVTAGFTESASGAPDGDFVRIYPLSAFSAGAPPVTGSTLEAESSPVRGGTVAVDSKTGELYVSEPHRVSAFSPDGALLYRFGASAYFSVLSKGLAVKSAPSGPAERVYVSSLRGNENANVTVFGPVTKAVVRTHLSVANFGKDGSAGTTFSPFGVRSLAFRSSLADLFAADAGVPGIYGFDASALPVFPPLAGFSPLAIAPSNFPPGLAADNTGLTSAGNIYYSSDSTNKLYGFDPSGAPLAGFPIDPAVTPGPPVGSPVNLGKAGVDPEGNIWVANRTNNRVLRYSSSGSYLGAVDFSTKGEVRSIAFEPGGDMYVSQGKGGIWRYTAPGYISSVQIHDKTEGQPPITVDPSTGDLYIAHPDHVDIYGADGKFIEEIGSSAATNQQYVILRLIRRPEISSWPTPSRSRSASSVPA